MNLEVTPVSSGYVPTGEDEGLKGVHSLRLSGGDKSLPYRQMSLSSR